MNIFGRLCHKFVTNKKLSLLIFFGVIFWGVISFIVTPKQYNPEITAPAFDIRVDFPGATSREVYELVTRPLEDVVQQIPGVDKIYSQSHHGGYSIVTVLFYVGDNFDLSKIRLSQKIASNLDLKPLNVKNIMIKAVDPDDLPIMTIGLFSKNLSPVELRKRAFKIRNALKLISGTSIVDVVGGQKREFEIIVNPERLRETKTSLSDVEKALSKSSLLSVLGVIKGEEQFLTVETTGKVATVKEIEELVVSSNVEMSLRVKDVAKVIEGVTEEDSYVNYYDKDISVDHAVFLTVAKKKGKNISSVARAVTRKIKGLKKDTQLFSGIDTKILRDEGRVASEEIGRLTFNLIQAICIVFVVLFIFLNVRAAVMVAITIPLTLLTVFGIGQLAGYTINRITLFALILSLGLLVDSATVVVENIVRNKKDHPDWNKPKVITVAVSEVGTGLFLSTLTTVLAFIPMGFVTGMMGPYMGPLPFFVSAAIIVSLIYSYTIVPWLASIFCRKGPYPQDKKSRFNDAYDRLINWYSALIKNILDKKRNRKRVMAVSALLIIIVLTFPALKFLRFRMLPKADREQVYVYLDLDLGTSIDKTYKISKALAEELKSLPNVEGVEVFAGTPQILDFNGLFKGSASRRGTNQATLKLNLTHPHDRDKKSEELALKYRQKILEWMKPYKDARIQIIEDPPGPPVRGTFFVKVKSNDQELVKKVVRDLEKESRGIDQLFDVDTTIPEPLTKYTLKVDTERAAKAMVSTSAIARVLEVLYRGSVIGIFHDDKNLEQEYIVLKFSKERRNDIDDLEEIMIVNEMGNPVPIKDFVLVEKAPNSNVILGDNREETVYISGEMGSRSVTYAAIDFLKKLLDYRPPVEGAKRGHFSPMSVRYDLPDGKWIKVEMGGEWKMTLEVFRDLGIAMLIAIILIYMVLVAQFRSYLLPLLISVTIPLTLVGVFPGFSFLFMVGKVYFSATSMIGVIALSGIVVNNAIILLEYMMQRAKAGDDLKKAIIDSCAIRFRPIVLTSLTTILGSLAIAGDPVWSGLAWSIAFGLSLSAVLTLIVFPTLVFHSFEKKGFPKEEVCEI